MEKLLNQKVTSPKTTHRLRDPEETLRRLVDAALTILANKGYANATIDEIVQQAECSKGAFYHHFSSKEELFLYLLEHRFMYNQQRLRELCCWEGKASDWISGVIQTILSFPQNDRRWKMISIDFMSYGMRNEHVAKNIARMHQEWRDLIADPLLKSEEYRSGRMIVDPSTIATCVIALIDGLIMQASMEPEQISLTRLAQRMEPLFRAWFKD
jgi:AcrR family transcriptional regulator